MDYLELSGATISERDKAFAQEFANFVNGSMSSPDRNEWASRLSAEAYQRLIECDLIFDPEFPTSK